MEEGDLFMYLKYILYLVMLMLHLVKAIVQENPLPSKYWFSLELSCG